MQSNLDLVCFGEVLYDIYEDTRVLAGAPLNVASSASALGLKTAMVSAVGLEDYGLISQELTERGVVSYLQKSALPTGTAKVSLDERGVPTFVITEKSAWDDIHFEESLGDLSSKT